MFLRINNVRQAITEEFHPERLAAARLGLPVTAIKSAVVLRRAVDARRKPHLNFVYHLLVEAELKPAVFAGRKQETDITVWQEPVKIPEPVFGGRQMAARPIIIGAGPAGLLCAHRLATYGYRPLLLERGKRAEERARDVAAFWGTGSFDPESNVQFGEGGAGTFSDGKLTTRVNDPFIGEILRLFTEAGAPPEILTEQKPHIGTDKLRSMVASLTAQIREKGGEVRFEERAEELLINGDGVSGVVLANGERLEADAVILACGHSARDTYAMLAAHSVAMQPKQFSVGVRIELPQELIDRAQYGELAGHPSLGPAEFSLVHHDQKSGRSAYSFCMCPGGVVVAAASETGGIVTNGMSLYARNSGIANSALVVNVGPEDFGTEPLDGVRFQRHWESLAFAKCGGNYAAPAQNCGSFLSGTGPSLTSGLSATYRPGVVAAELREVLPDFVTTALQTGIAAFGRKIKGFADEGNILTGVETRTSAPLRILRDTVTLESVSHSNLYPTGEGAGYAGGIVSAALDGLRVAGAVMMRFKPLA